MKRLSDSQRVLAAKIRGIFYADRNKKKHVFVSKQLYFSPSFFYLESALETREDKHERLYEQAVENILKILRWLNPLKQTIFLFLLPQHMRRELFLDESDLDFEQVRVSSRKQ